MDYYSDFFDRGINIETETNPNTGEVSISKFKPSSLEGLKHLVNPEKIGVEIPLGMIDISNLSSLNTAFEYVNRRTWEGIETWDTKNISSMRLTFSNSNFKGGEAGAIGNIDNWNLSKLVSADYMFQNSLFNGDISKWNEQPLENLNSTYSMFAQSAYSGDFGENVLNKFRDELNGDKKNMYYGSQNVEYYLQGAYKDKYGKTDLKDERADAKNFASQAMDYLNIREADFNKTPNLAEPEKIKESLTNILNEYKQTDIFKKSIQTNQNAIQKEQSNDKSVTQDSAEKEQATDNAQELNNNEQPTINNTDKAQELNSNEQPTINNTDKAVKPSLEGEPNLTVDITGTNSDAVKEYIGHNPTVDNPMRLNGEAALKFFSDIHSSPTFKDVKNIIVNADYHVSDGKGNLLHGDTLTIEVDKNREKGVIRSFYDDFIKPTYEKIKDNFSNAFSFTQKLFSRAVDNIFLSSNPDLSLQAMGKQELERQAAERAQQAQEAPAQGQNQEKQAPQKEDKELASNQKEQSNDKSVTQDSAEKEQATDNSQTQSKAGANIDQSTAANTISADAANDKATDKNQEQSEPLMDQKDPSQDDSLLLEEEEKEKSNDSVEVNPEEKDKNKDDPGEEHVPADMWFNGDLPQKEEPDSIQMEEVPQKVLTPEDIITATEDEKEKDSDKTKQDANKESDAPSQASTPVNNPTEKAQEAPAQKKNQENKAPQQQDKNNESLVIEEHVPEKDKAADNSKSKASSAPAKDASNSAAQPAPNNKEAASKASDAKAQANTSTDANKPADKANAPKPQAQQASNGKLTVDNLPLQTTTPPILQSTNDNKQHMVSFKAIGEDGKVYTVKFCTTSPDRANAMKELVKDVGSHVLVKGIKYEKDLKTIFAQQIVKNKEKDKLADKQAEQKRSEELKSKGKSTEKSNDNGKER